MFQLPDLTRRHLTFRQHLKIAAEEFDLLCMLLANSLVVHTDETGWSIRSVWAFLSEKVRVIFFGVPKDAETLEADTQPSDVCGDIDQR